MRVSINADTPIAECFIMENPTKMDDLGVPLFRNPPYIYIWYLSENSPYLRFFFERKIRKSQPR